MGAIVAHGTLCVSIVHDKPDHLAVHALCCPLEGSLDVYRVHVLLGVGIYYAVRCLCMHVHTASVVQGHNWLWEDYMQQWYEFTTAGGAA